MNKLIILIVTTTVMLSALGYTVLAYDSYDYRPTVHPGYMVIDYESDGNGRNGHNGRGLVECVNGDILLIYSNTSGHNVDGWSEYVRSTDGGETWGSRTYVQASKDEYDDADGTVSFSEGAVVAPNGTVIIFLTYYTSTRVSEKYVRSFDNGTTWTGLSEMNSTGTTKGCTDYHPTVYNNTIFKLTGGSSYTELYVSTNNGSSFHKRSNLPLDGSASTCLMKNNSIIAYDYAWGYNVPYTISEDEGYTWSPASTTYMAKQTRNSQLNQIGDYYFLHGRAGGTISKGVIYTSSDGINWDTGFYYDNVDENLDWYSCNAIIGKYDSNTPNKMLIQYSDYYGSPSDCNVLAFFVENISGTEVSSSQEVNISFQSINNLENDSVTQDQHRYFNWTRDENTTIYSIRISNTSAMDDIFFQLDNITVSNGNCTNTFLNTSDSASLYGYNYWENSTHCFFYLPYCYNITEYKYHYYQVRAYTA